MPPLSPMLIVVMFAFGLLFFQGIFSIFQYKVITKKYKEVLSRSPLIAVGKTKRIGRGCIVMMGFTSDGYLTEGYILKGITVFARFQAMKGMEGESHLSLQKQLEAKKPSLERDAILQAIGYVCQKFKTTDAEGQLPQAIIA